MKTQFLIAAPMSGSGKTTIARELMAMYVAKGRRVQPFKCGPDYIDTKFHEAVCGRPSINLDTFMTSPEHVRELYQRYGADADVCIVEGMMGLYDGYERDRGSAAEIARVLGLPVVMVVDARSAAYSLAPLLQGFINFRPDVHIAGIIFNKVGSPRHERMLRQVCLDLGIHCLACVPRRLELEQQSRYLGLDFSALPQAPQGHPRPDTMTSTTKAVVARNAESFSFIYQETLDALGSVDFFDPETEVPRLEGCQLLYLPGGYPEKHLAALVRNEAARRAIRHFAQQGGRIVAECGGMMYLCEKILTDEGEWPMCGVLPYVITARKVDRRLSLGYRQFELDGRQYRGHEFHYTQFLHQPPSCCQVFDAKGEPVATPVVCHGNVLASYTHLYLNETNLY
ncbi:MAG: AAA family ATPase [Prevotella sp.]|nr:AAA family ATPase [Prevotella sp.]